MCRFAGKTASSNAISPKPVGASCTRQQHADAARQLRDAADLNQPFGIAANRGARSLRRRGITKWLTPAPTKNAARTSAPDVDASDPDHRSCTGRLRDRSAAHRPSPSINERRSSPVAGGSPAAPARSARRPQGCPRRCPQPQAGGTISGTGFGVCAVFGCRRDRACGRRCRGRPSRCTRRRSRGPRHDLAEAPVDGLDRRYRRRDHARVSDHVGVAKLIIPNRPDAACPRARPP